MRSIRGASGRRSFTAEYRARVVAEYEAAPHGQKPRCCGGRPVSVQSGNGRLLVMRLGRGAPAPGGRTGPACLRKEG